MFIHVNENSGRAHTAEGKSRKKVSKPRQLSEIKPRYKLMDSSQKPDHVSTVIATPTKVCYGCGREANICMKCSQSMREKDVCAYKQQLAVGVEWLFAKATKRAFNAMDFAVKKWIFGAWKREFSIIKTTRKNACHHLFVSRTRKSWYRWRTFVYKRRAAGALLLAEQQECININLQTELANTRREKLQLEKDYDMLRIQLKNESEGRIKALSKLHDQNRELKTELRSMESKNNSLSSEIHDLRGNAEERKKMLSKLQQIHDYRKTCFQLADVLLKTLLSIMDDTLNPEGHPNLHNVFPAELLKELDQPENMSLYDKDSAADKTDDLICNEKMASPDRAERVLQKWTSHMTRKMDPNWIRSTSNLVNFGSCFRDGSVYAVLTRRMHDDLVRAKPRRKGDKTLLRPGGLTLGEDAQERFKELVKRESDPGKRISTVLSTMGRALWLPEDLVDVNDILAENEKFNLCFLSYAFCTAEPSRDEFYTKSCLELQTKLHSLRDTWNEWREEADTDDSIAAKAKLGSGILLDIRKKVLSLHNQSNDGYLIWWKAMRIVLRNAFLTMSNLAHRDRDLRSEDAGTKSEFTIVSHETLTPLVQTIALNVKGELRMIEEYLETIAYDMARIYRSNCADESPHMTKETFKDLASRCGLITEEFKEYDLNQLISEKIESILLPAEFVDCLIRISIAQTRINKAKGREKSSNPVSDYFYFMMSSQVIPLAFVSGVEGFRKQLEDPDIIKLLGDYGNVIKKGFNRYSTTDSSGKKKKKKRIKVVKLIQLFEDYEIIDKTFTVEDAVKLIRHVCYSNNEQDLFDCEIELRLFHEILLATACYKHPDPYLTVQQRIETFFKATSLLMS